MAIWRDTPSRIWREAPSRIQCLLSIGTGAPEFGAKTLMPTKTEDTEEFFRNSASLGVVRQYFRFNVNQGLENIALDDCDTESMVRIMSASKAFLLEGRVQEMVEEFRSAMRPQHSKPNNIFLIHRSPVTCVVASPNRLPRKTFRPLLLSGKIMKIPTHSIQI